MKFSLKALFGLGKPAAPKRRPKVIGIGLAKTGTTTLGACLRQLGYRVFEFQPAVVEAVARGDIDAALDVLEDYDGMEDFPFNMLVEQLDKRFPGSRFVLTVRKDSEAWAESARKHFERRKGARIAELARECFVRHATAMGGDLDDLPSLHTRHNEWVQRYFAGRPNDLITLCWENGDGWKQLCEFLGDAVPAGVPFPHENAAPVAG